MNEVSNGYLDRTFYPERIELHQDVLAEHDDHLNLDLDDGEAEAHHLGLDLETAEPPQGPRDITFGSYQFPEDNHPTDKAYKDSQGNYYRSYSDYLKGVNKYTK